MRDMTLLYIAFGAMALPACERGCLSKDNAGTAMAVKQDCPTGLVRCLSGSIEATEGREACPGCGCAWKRIRVCEQGCAIEGVELVREPSATGPLCKGPAQPDLATLPKPDAGD